MRHLFLSGEYATTLQMCVRRADWQHTTVARQMRAEGRFLRYGAVPHWFRSVLWYCSVDDDGMRIGNLKALRASGAPVWPSLDLLERWDDRRTKLAFALHNGLVDDVEFSHWSPRRAERDLVVKVGNQHLGEGKLLVLAGQELPPWDNLASIEPFVRGESVRVYVVGETVGVVHYENQLSWIKNSPGAVTHEVDERDPDVAPMVEHARRVHDLYGFPVSGVDYVLRDDGTFRFLEHNHFPGITLHSGVEREILRVLSEAMDYLEEASGT